MSSNSRAVSLRGLQSQADLNSQSGGDGVETEFSPAVFWGVNGFLAFLLVSVCTWCWCFGGGIKRWRPTEQRQQASDARYQETLRRRQEERNAIKNNPIRRKKKLLQSFKRCRVTKTVKAEDITLEPPPQYPPAKKEDTSNNGEEEQPDEKSVNGTDEEAKNLSTIEEASSSDSAAAAEAIDAVVVKSSAPEENGTSDFSDALPAESAHSTGSVRTAVSDNRTDAVIAEIGSLKDDNEQSQSLSAQESNNENVMAKEVDEEIGSMAGSEMDEELGSVASDGSGTQCESGDEVAFAAPGVDEEEEICETGYLRIRANRYVPNCCAICLCSYEPGETVVWSPNAECRHAFHLECITDWLTKMTDGTPCPCCRQEFTDLEAQRKERKVTWRAGSAFNLNHISL